MTRTELLTEHTVGDVINNPILRDYIGGELQVEDRNMSNKFNDQLLEAIYQEELEKFKDPDKALASAERIFNDRQ